MIPLQNFPVFPSFPTYDIVSKNGDLFNLDGCIWFGEGGSGGEVGGVGGGVHERSRQKKGVRCGCVRIKTDSIWC